MKALIFNREPRGAIYNFNVKRFWNYCNNRFRWKWVEINSFCGSRIEWLRRSRNIPKNKEKVEKHWCCVSEPLCSPECPSLCSASAPPNSEVNSDQNRHQETNLANYNYLGEKGKIEQGCHLLPRMAYCPEPTMDESDTSTESKEEVNQWRPLKSRIWGEVMVHQHQVPAPADIDKWSRE